jgi:hypothetical protein
MGHHTLVYTGRDGKQVLQFYSIPIQSNPFYFILFYFILFYAYCIFQTNNNGKILVTNN